MTLTAFELIVTVVVLIFAPSDHEKLVSWLLHYIFLNIEAKLDIFSVKLDLPDKL